MLHFIRETAKGWVAWVIIGLLIVPFALWGINSYFENGASANVAIVNGNEISLREYQQTYQQQRSRIRSMLGANANADLVDSLLKPQDIIDGMVERELLLQSALEGGFRVADQQLAMQIQSIEAFQQDGQFSKPTYERLLGNQGYSTAYFEASMLQDSLISQINSGLKGTTFVTQADLDRYIRLKNQEREVSSLVIPASKYEKNVSVSDEEINKYYDENAQRFINPEKVSVSYVELKVSDLQSLVNATEEDLRKTYEEQKSSFGVGEERKASHILIQIENPDDKNADKAALDKANELVKKIKAGESFAELARKNSEDPGSAEQGGDLGYFGKGLMDPAFEEATFALQEGKVSDPVKTSFGYHIIKLEKIRGGSQKPFEQIRDEVKRIFTQQKAEAQFFDQAEIMANQAYEQPDSLEAVAEALNLEIKTSESFTSAGGKGIAAHQKLVQLAFSNDVLKQGFNSEPIEVSVNHLVVIHKKDHEPESQKGLDEVKMDIKVILEKLSASKQAEAAGEKIINSINNEGGDPASVAKELKLVWTEKSFITRRDTKLDRNVVNAVFKKNKPAENKVLTEGVNRRNGDYIVYQLSAVRDPDLSKVGDAEKQQLSKELNRVYSNEEFDDYLSSIKQGADISIFAENMQ